MIISCPTEADWHRERSLSIGASEAAAALGLSPWLSADEWVAVKSGRAADEERKGRKREWGQRIEPLIGLAYGEKHGLLSNLRPNGRTIWRNPKWPFLHATPDFVVTIPETGLTWPVETKNGTKLDREGNRVWGEAGDQIPDDRKIQVQLQVAIMEAPFGALAALVDGWEYREWTLHPDEEFLSLALPKLEAAWGRVEAARAEVRRIA